jgi:translation initiation factor IF-2
LQKEKVRVYILARELNMESKDLLEICRQAGIDVKNQLSSLDADQREVVEKLLHRKAGGPATATVPAAVTAAAPTAASASSGHSNVAVLAPPAPSGSPHATPASSPPPPALPVVTPTKIPELGRPIRNLNQKQPRPVEGGDDKSADKRREPPRSNLRTPPILATPPKLKAPPPKKEEKKPDEPKALKPTIRLTPEMLRPGGATKDVAEELKKRLIQGQPTAVPPTFEEEEDESGKRPRPGVVGRDERHKKRNERAKTRREREEVAGRPGANLGVEEDDRPAAKRIHRLRKPELKKGTQPRKGRAPIELPITVRSLSEAVGRPVNELLRRLMERGQMMNINTILEPSVAEELAIDLGLELEIKKPLDPEELLLSKLQGDSRPEDLVHRAPIVTVMGHVDHGKTSLLDRIRESNVVATEAGGITQHLRAWRVEHNGRSITFLDTPGHEAFTQMRARGAHVTDIVILVVAADDGVMPQTEEAINHAKAAGVPIVVVINKVDLPNANLNRTRQQLYAHELIPDNMGGDVPFIETVCSKDKARGINELLEMLALMAELKDLKANPKRPGQGTCLEAKLSEGEGVLATLLVRDGTLRRGDVILCGAAYGRVRAMYDDLGRPLEEALPSWPARITGLDQVPNADDPFNVVPDLTIAREIAEKRSLRQRAAAPVKLSTFRLEDLDKAKVAEVKLIIKADVRGSIEAIRKEMEKLSHEEVRVNVLHTGIGGITESDVQLALASPQDTLVVGFNVVPDDRALSLADEKGIQIRQYDIIYQLTDDIRSALEGKLKPREEVVHLGRAVVRDTFKISRVGTIAGCYVTQGTIERSARIRLIREGVVIFPPADRVASLESLKRFKDDVREVREGFECGLKLAGYDDVKVGDVIEAYRVEQVQRTL